jgi:hypothetical protein
MKIIAGSILILAAAILAASTILAEAIQLLSTRAGVAYGAVQIIAGTIALVGVLTLGSGLSNDATDRAPREKPPQ